MQKQKKKMNFWVEGKKTQQLMKFDERDDEVNKDEKEE